ncbi:hypothetical protein VP1G_10489 [Cytospora mali]|uniref:Uncharacterized protein n=1 Tax=Cytospora mali TaxID=578113 RepID=A0A194ULV4_CYTMA|nr:hypothetical protein VP1G_10489 [Valsa mali var. pyri (nom. inval.)]
MTGEHLAVPHDLVVIITALTDDPGRLADGALTEQIDVTGHDRPPAYLDKDEKEAWKQEEVKKREREAKAYLAAQKEAREKGKPVPGIDFEVDGERSPDMRDDALLTTSTAMSHPEAAGDVPGLLLGGTAVAATRSSVATAARPPVGYAVETVSETVSARETESRIGDAVELPGAEAAPAIV